MAKIITLASAVGGMGKSTLCVSLAYALGKAGKRVLLIDLCPEAPALDILVGVGESVVYTVLDVIEGTVSAETALLSLPVSKKAPYKENILLAPLSPCTVSCAENLGQAVRSLTLAAHADFTVVDASAELYPSLYSVSDERLLLTEPRESALRGAEALAARYAQSAPFDKFLLMRASLVRERILRQEPLIDMIDRISLPLLGILPQCELLRDHGVLWEGRYAKEPYVRATENLAARLCGDSVPVLSGITLEGISRRAFIEK